MKRTMTELQALRQALQKQISFWHSNRNDPHGIGNAVLGALYAIEQALTDADLSRHSDTTKDL